MYHPKRLIARISSWFWDFFIPILDGQTPRAVYCPKMCLMAKPYISNIHVEQTVASFMMITLKVANLRADALLA